ncbi:MAG: esterase family protein, partial [Clostridia bacterium]|nr:esterase family protein [Clostridia bacterium]
MALINLKFFSEALGMQTEALVVMPQRGNYGEIGIESNAKAGPYKCLYLLHGLSDDHTIWLRRTSIERYASYHGICVVMPRGDRSFYSDMKYGMPYYTHIAKELPKVIREYFNISDKQEDNFIAGLSMGGYGALKIGLRECGKFAACAGISPCGDLKKLPEFNDVFRPIFGDSIEIPAEDDLLAAELDLRKGEACHGGKQQRAKHVD